MIIYSSSNYSALDDLNSYIELYNTKENKFLENANFALKIMPGYNSERNAIYMEQTNNV